MIDSQQASEALAEIDEITRRVRQSRIYNLASQIMIMWGVLVFIGYVGAFLWPRNAGYLWAVLNLAGVAGSFAISAVGYPKSRVRTFDTRMLIAFLIFFAFGFLCTGVLGQFTPRQMSTFWPIYFMLLYIIPGLWFGHAFVVIGLGISALALLGYFFAGPWFDLWMAFVDGGGLLIGGFWMRRS